ncbi:MAG: OmpH family outer membrane protein [Bacteroidota bacterium]
MQKIFFLALTLVTLLFGPEAQAVSADKQVLPLKIGYTNVEYIFDLLPERKKIESEYASFEKQLGNQMQTKYGEFQQKLKAFQQGQETMKEAVRNKKQLELQQLNRSLEQLQVESQEKLAKKRASLFNPLYEKIQSKIKEVAKENSYTHVFSANPGGIPVLLYASEEHDISKLVLKKLGISPAKHKKKK